MTTTSGTLHCCLTEQPATTNVTSAVVQLHDKFDFAKDQILLLRRKKGTAGTRITASSNAFSWYALVSFAGGLQSQPPGPANCTATATLCAPTPRLTHEGEPNRAACRYAREKSVFPHQSPSERERCKTRKTAQKHVHILANAKGFLSGALSLASLALSTHAGGPGGSTRTQAAARRSD